MKGSIFPVFVSGALLTALVAGCVTDPLPLHKRVIGEKIDPECILNEISFCILNFGQVVHVDTIQSTNEKRFRVFVGFDQITSGVIVAPKTCAARSATAEDIMLRDPSKPTVIVRLQKDGSCDIKLEFAGPTGEEDMEIYRHIMGVVRVCRKQPCSGLTVLQLLTP